MYVGNGEFDITQFDRQQFKLKNSYWYFYMQNSFLCKISKTFLATA